MRDNFPPFVIALTILSGCAAPERLERSRSAPLAAAQTSLAPAAPIRLVAFEADEHSSPSPHFSSDPESEANATEIDALVEEAVGSNPKIRMLAQEYRAARAKVRYIDELPDPTISATFFGHPVETAAGSQRSNLTITQLLPWLDRLDAQAQQACFEAAALFQLHAAERLRVIADIRVQWFRLYVISRQIEIHTANQELLNSLIDVANARVATGNASQGDVLIGTLEYTKLEETLVGLRQQLASTKAEINRLVGRAVETPVESATELEVQLPDWDHPLLREIAKNHQPEIESARIRAQASRWGIEVARLQRRPDFSINASWFAIDDNRPVSAIVDVGRDAWAVGAMVTLPLGHEKYDAMEQEARWKHAATHSSVETLMQQYDSMLLDLWEQARAADETARLYRDTIIPEAQRTLNTDQESYANGEVDFDRVVQDFRNLLTLELGFHRSVGRMATAIARIEQAVGTELTTP